MPHDLLALVTLGILENYNYFTTNAYQCANKCRQLM